MDSPKLIDNGAINYMYDALQICHANRVKIYYIGLNVGVFILFVLVVGLILYYCYKRKPSPYELKKKMMKALSVPKKKAGPLTLNMCAKIYSII